MELRKGATGFTAFCDRWCARDRIGPGRIIVATTRPARHAAPAFSWTAGPRNQRAGRAGRRRAMAYPVRDAPMRSLALIVAFIAAPASAHTIETAAKREVQWWVLLL